MRKEQNALPIIKYLQKKTKYKLIGFVVSQQFNLKFLSDTHKIYVNLGMYIKFEYVTDSVRSVSITPVHVKNKLASRRNAIVKTCKYSKGFCSDRSIRRQSCTPLDAFHLKRRWKRMCIVCVCVFLYVCFYSNKILNTEW